MMFYVAFLFVSHFAMPLNVCSTLKNTCLWLFLFSLQAGNIPSNLETGVVMSNKVAISVEFIWILLKVQDFANISDCVNGFLSHCTI